jgi:hypothetical protein
VKEQEKEGLTWLAPLQTHLLATEVEDQGPQRADE